MYIVDSSVWVALFLDNDTQHVKAVAVMEKIGASPISIPYGVVLETATVLSRKQSKALANRFVEYVRDNPQISVQMSFMSEDMRVFLEENDRLSFVDALIKNMAVHTGFVLVSFDKRLLRSARRASPRAA